jgi:UDP-N-acetylglucosamine:LPS N-acetylglucosamine transferase
MVRDADLARGRLDKVAEELIGEPARLVRMGESARAWGRPDAARALARVVVSILDRQGRT